jgi:hypothetical protein
VDLRVAPRDRIKSLGRQRFERAALLGGEDLGGDLPGGPVDPRVGDLGAPPREVSRDAREVVALVRGERREARALGVLHPRLHLALLARIARGRGVDREAVVLRQRAAAAVKLRGRAGDREGGADDGGLEVVRDDRRGHAAELLEGLDVQTHPGVGALVEDDAGDDPPAVREDHHEDPRVAPLAGAWVAQLADVAEVDLGDLAGRRDDRDGDVVGARSVGMPEAAAEALDLRVAALVGRLAEAQAIEDGTGADGLVEQGLDLVTPVLDARPLLGRELDGRAVLLDERPQGREFWERLGAPSWSPSAQKEAR